VVEVSDIIDELEAFIPKEEPRKWAKLSSEIQYRRLQLLLLKEILLELKKISNLLEQMQPKQGVKPTAEG